MEEKNYKDKKAATLRRASGIGLLFIHVFS